MASGILPFRPALIRAGINTAADGEPDRSRNSSSAKWWSPIFGFSSDPEYLKSGEKSSEHQNQKPVERSRFAPCSFTEEKARQLRRRMSSEASSCHESMYHSTIASRLASDFSDRNLDERSN